MSRISRQGMSAWRLWTSTGTYRDASPMTTTLKSTASRMVRSDTKRVKSTPAVNCRIFSVAPMMSHTRSRADLGGTDRLGEDRVPHLWPQRVGGDEVHAHPEQVFEVELQTRQAEERYVVVYVDQQVHVAVGPYIASRDRS